MGQWGVIIKFRVIVLWWWCDVAGMAKNRWEEAGASSQQDHPLPPP